MVSSFDSVEDAKRSDFIAVDKKFTSDFDIDGLTVAGVDSDANKWRVIKDEAYRPDKNKFVLDQFKQQFPKQGFVSADQCYKLASRNNSAKKFLSEINLDYAAIEKEPTYYRDYIDAKAYDNVSLALRSIRKVNRDRANELKELALQYKERCEKTIAKYDVERAKIPESQELFVIGLNQPDLPQTLTSSIVNYSALENTAPNAKIYASELLVNYKLALLKKIQSDPTVDIKALVESSNSK